MTEIDDYNGDFFFEGERELEEYHSILDSLESYDYSPTEEEKYFSYNIMIFEQCLSILRELSDKNIDLGVAAQNTIYSLKKFIEIYTEGEN